MRCIPSRACLLGKSRRRARYGLSGSRRWSAPILAAAPADGGASSWGWSVVRSRRAEDRGRDVAGRRDRRYHQPLKVDGHQTGHEDAKTRLDSAPLGKPKHNPTAASSTSRAGCRSARIGANDPGRSAVELVAYHFQALSSPVSGGSRLNGWLEPPGPARGTRSRPTHPSRFYDRPVLMPEPASRRAALLSCECCDADRVIGGCAGHAHGRRGESRPCQS